MYSIEEGSLLWKPSAQDIQESNLQKFMQFLQREKSLSLENDQDLWKWSVTEIEQFWESLWEYFEVQSKTPYHSVLTERKMPGAKWFNGATINYTEHIFRNKTDQRPAIIHSSEMRELEEISWERLYTETAAFQKSLKQLGVKKGDRVVAYTANIYENIVAFLATASLGALWSSASPDFGRQSVIDRFKQIEPKVMVTVDGYSYAGKHYDRTEVIKNIQAELPSLEATIVIPFLKEEPPMEGLKNAQSYEQAIQQPKSQLTFEHVEFNDPLWILFSSGTTGVPKPIVHSQGGILLEHLKALTFHHDLKEGDRFFWYTTTGWMMWNFLVGALLAKSTIVLYDGSPVYPHVDQMWALAEETKMTLLGTSASYIMNCIKNDQKPAEDYDLSQLRSIGSTGSPLPPEGFKWSYERVKQDLWIASISGGTDVCTAFILGSPSLPVHAGELQCRGLGAKIESFSPSGESLINEIGELVITEPMPAMPIYFWKDEDGSRLHESYFDVYDQVWCHGDYLKITDRGSCVIYGRSDATINRGGIRIGTSEIYRAVDQVPEIADSLIVDIPHRDKDSIVPLFVILKEGKSLDDEIQQNIKGKIRSFCSPRHVPTHIFQVQELPMTLNGKKLEIPIKRILMGEKIDHVVNVDSLANRESLDYFLDFAQNQMPKL